MAHSSSRVEETCSKQNMCSKFSKSQRQRFTEIQRVTCNWIYSWMRPRCCENYEEYEVSKTLLFMFLKSNSALKACNDSKQIIQKMIDFTSQCVTVCDYLFLHFLRIAEHFFDMNKGWNETFC